MGYRVWVGFFKRKSNDKLLKVGIRKEYLEHTMGSQQ